jgi:hypothetical protein
MDSFARKRLAECLAAQARLCERIAGECADEERAQTFKDLSRECQDAAAQERPE